MQGHDLGHQDVHIPTRTESSHSLSSQSTRYSDYFDDSEDMTIAIAQYEDPADKENSRYGIPSTPSLNSSQSARKRKREMDEEPEAGPPRQTPKATATQEVARQRSGSRSTLVDSASSGPSSSHGSSRTLGPTPPSLGHRARPTTRKTKPVVPTPAAPVIPASSSLPEPIPPPLVPSTPTTRSHISETPAPPITVPPAWRAPEPVVVAQFGRYAYFIEPLPWGAQWELARYLNTSFSIESLSVQMLSDLRKLGTNAVAAPEVTRFFKALKPKKDSAASDGGASKPKKEPADPDEDVFAAAFARELSAKLPWDELDKEEEILREHPFGSIGCNQNEPFCAKDPDWYGGRVHFTASLRKKDGRLKFELERPVLGSSNRFARRFGSRRFIRVRVHKDLLHGAVGDELKEYFRRPFIVGCAVFRAFYAKEQNVFLFRTNEEVAADSTVVQPTPSSTAAQRELSLMDFLKWHNDLELNSGQTMVKWAARFALGLSNSVPGIRLGSVNVRFIDDIICDAFTGTGKPPSEMQMTDGAGFANRAVMRLLKASVKFGSGELEPTAVQVRIGGAKGLLVIRHDLSVEEEQEPTVWLRPSQLKIIYSPHPFQDCILPADADPALRTIDVLRASRLQTPARLSVETITNLAENGVPPGYFKQLFEVDLQTRIDELLKYKAEADMPLLWHTVASAGRVIHQRLAQEQAGVARARGYVAEDYDDDNPEDEDEDGASRALREQSSAWWPDPVSGCPSGLEETCMALLESGFTPAKLQVLRAKLREVALKTVTAFSARYKISVAMSCSAFIVPDPCGVLGPNEIHVKSSRRNLVDQEGRQTDIVLGDVLVTRHPCKVPSDFQKVKAVFHEKLRYYCDVIVVSTKSHLWQGQPLNRHLASLTGGGDYDGDTMEVFWDPKIVGPFVAPDPRLYATEPPEVQQCLVKNTETVSAFLARVPPTASEEYKIFVVQDYLLGALRGRSYVSKYSTWWEKSTYAQGYAHPETVFLAYMFCALLDGTKTGVTIDPVAYGRHERKWEHRGALGWKPVDAKAELKLKFPDNPVVKVKRDTALPTFIMDHLFARVQNVCAAQRKRIERDLATTGVFPLDEDLARPWRDAKARAEKQDELERAARQEAVDRAMKQAGVSRAKRGEKDGHSPRGAKSPPGKKGKEKEELSLMSRELKRIKEHVETRYAEATKGKRGAGGSFTDQRIETRQDFLREHSRLFHAGPADLLCFSEDEAAVLKASYAYLYDREQKNWSRFPWDVAMRVLCEIKAKACGGSKTLADNFYRYFELSRAYVRQRKQDIDA